MLLDIFYTQNLISKREDKWPMLGYTITQTAIVGRDRKLMMGKKLTYDHI